MNSFKVNDKEFFVNIDNESSFFVSSQLKNYGVGFITFKKLQELAESGEYTVIIDEKISFLYKIKSSLKVECLEKYKNLQTVENICEKLDELNLSKNSKLLIVGGGILQDICSTVACLYKRGLDWTFVPTTLLAMCDSCIGSKTSLNLSGSKNQLGTFNPPNEILLCTDFLETLSKDEMASGFGEIIKLNLMLDKHRSIELNSKELNILNCLSIKKVLIEEDEFDKDHRKSLNYGHTIGHCLESMTDYKLPHGYAILVGMYLENLISKELGLLNKDYCMQINEFIKTYDHLNFIKKKLENYSGIDFIEFLKRDKKNTSKEVVFSLLVEPKHVKLIKVPFENLETLLDKVLNT